MIKVGSIVRDPRWDKLMVVGIVTEVQGEFADAIIMTAYPPKLNFASFDSHRTFRISDLVELRDVVEVPAGTNRIDTLTRQVSEVLDRQEAKHGEL